MKQGEKGFGIIELAVAFSIMAFIGCAAAAATFRVIKDTERSNNHMTVVRQVQNAGYWISHDAQSAESMVTDNLELPNFIVLSWTEQDYEGGDPTYHSVTYFFEDLSNGVGKLKRSRWSSAGVSQEILVANYIYYDPNDPDNTSGASYENPVLTAKLAAVYGDFIETKEYKILRRPNL